MFRCLLVSPPSSEKLKVEHNIYLNIEKNVNETENEDQHEEEMNQKMENAG